ncbi:hypothetical protein EVAR_49162_1 [Eumeta japonica]|uniref:Uncharacterized protein n=1 Tax=Eumeta variegata TaxID=151549 RepID=A0A4C1YNW4_EUMVA|nr:hypothetical protein EVAR_49162_1 [Eumeta japonica]
MTRNLSIYLLFLIPRLPWSRCFFASGLAGGQESGQKKVVWPPVPEANGYHSPQNQQQAPAYYNNTAHAPASQQHSPAPNQSYKQPQYHPQQAYQSQQQHSPYKTQPQQYQQPQAYSDGLRQESTGLSKLIPVGPGVSASPTRAAPLSPTAQRQQNRWAPVAAPTSPQSHVVANLAVARKQADSTGIGTQYTDMKWQLHVLFRSAYGTQPAYPSQQQAYPSQQQQHSPQPLYAPKPFEPPPATITLRPQQPVHQQPPPVFPSQPATASFKETSGGRVIISIIFEPEGVASKPDRGRPLWNSS